MTDYSIKTLPNDIRVIYQENTNTKLFHAAVMLDIGSRDEDDHQQGLAHLWEHMAFKGTKKRKSHLIFQKLESVGGEINASTSKEKISFHGTILAEHAEKLIDVLSDIVFFSVFPEKELEKEKKVIFEEIAMYEDDPAEVIAEHFDEIFFKDHALGKKILGTPDTLSSFSRESIVDFIEGNLNTSKIIFSANGSLPTKKLFNLTDKYFSAINSYSPSKSRKPYKTAYSRENLSLKRSIHQTQCVVGGIGTSILDPDFVPLSLLIHLLGGSMMSSKLNVALREKRGLVYDVQAVLQSYTDTGCYTIQFATDPKNTNRCVQSIKKEISTLRKQPLGNIQLYRLKQQVKGMLALSQENDVGVMLGRARQLLDRNEIKPIDAIFKEIEAIDSKKLIDTANKYLDSDNCIYLMHVPN